MTAAQTFNALHKSKPGFIMPNAWDPGSAIMLASEGFAAIATTSAGIAFSLGKPDYQVADARRAVSRTQMFEAMRAIVAAVDVPVNGDLEAGYGDTPEAVAQTIRLAIDIGLAGGNIEGSLSIPVPVPFFDVAPSAEVTFSGRPATKVTVERRLLGYTIEAVLHREILRGTRAGVEHCLLLHIPRVNVPHSGREQPFATVALLLDRATTSLGPEMLLGQIENYGTLEIYGTASRPSPSSGTSNNA